MKMNMEQYQAEAQEKWGKTEAYKEYEAKTGNYRKQNWNDLTAGMDHIMAQFAWCKQSGAAPDCAQAQDLVKALQSYITENCYHCTKEILAGLGQMYVADDRFQSNIDKHAQGTAVFICEAIKAYCDK